jgi:outer membrane receptor protein involved in Fe transport
VAALAATGPVEAEAQKRESYWSGTASRPAAAMMAPSLQLAQAGQERPYAIAPQPLADALTLFGQQSGLQVTLDAGIVAGLTTPGVNGSFTAEEALRRLLAGTGLTWRFTDANTVALAKPAGSGPGSITLAPVTVTGERVARSIMETSTSVVVFDSEAIEDRPRIDSTNDALARIPNVTTTGTTNFAPAVRGVDGTGPAQGADAFFAGTRPRLNVQVDGRPLSYNEVVFGDTALWDVEQVEVLRGPQSTLQGRNAIAGSVIVKTNDPTYDYEASGRILGGNQDTRQGSAYVSGPIVEDQLAFRLAVDRELSESFAHFTPYPGVSDPRQFESTTVRGKLLIEPEALAGFSTLITLVHSDYTAPQTELVSRPFDEHNSNFPDMPVFNPRSSSAILEPSWEIDENFTLEGTFSATDLLVKRKAPPGEGNAEIDGREVVTEPRLRISGFDGRLNGIGGIYFFDAEQDEFIDLFGGGTFDDHTRTAAIFGEATYSILEDVDITLGARFEQEKKRRTGGVGPFAIDLDETYDAFLPKFGVAWHAMEELTIGAVVARGYNGGGAGFTYDVPFQSYTFEPEYVWNYEAYARADLLGGKLALTGNLFFSDYKDMQLPFDLNPDPNIWAVVIRNADRVETYGAELGARWLALPGLELFGDLGLLKTEVTKNPGSGIEGHDLAQAPAVTADFGVIYRHESGVEFSADARFSDAYFSNIDNNPRGKTDPYFVVNSQIGYTFSNEYVDARIFAFVANIFDSSEPIVIEPGATPADDSAVILRPRTFGVGLQMTF